MKPSIPLLVIFIWLAVIFAPCGVMADDQAQAPPETVASQPARPDADAGAPGKTPPRTGSAGDEYGEDEDEDYEDEPFSEERVTIADPLEPVNRVMNTFNDRMYFWVLKPAAQGYKIVAPEPARISVKNFFSNLGYPARFVSCVLQTDFAGAATETGRFVINTVWGIGGLMDPAAGENFNLERQNTDLGQTLGVYGVGHGFYIVWPFFGPSSPRDTIILVADYILYPPWHIQPWYASTAVTAFEFLNNTSLRIGEYESLVGAAIDPYVAMRNAYIQYRMKNVKARQARSLLFKEGAAQQPEAGKTGPEN